MPQQFCSTHTLKSPKNTTNHTRRTPSIRQVSPSLWKNRKRRQNNKNCCHTIRINITTKHIKKNEIPIHNQNLKNDTKPPQKKHTDTHNSSTELTCKMQQQPAAPESRKRCQSGISNQYKHGKIFAKTHNIERCKKTNRKTQKGKETPVKFDSSANKQSHTQYRTKKQSKPVGKPTITCQ